MAIVSFSSRGKKRGCTSIFIVEMVKQNFGNYGLSRQQLQAIENIIEERQNEIRNAWQKYFQS
jgi:hypothetical protein